MQSMGTSHQVEAGSGRIDARDLRPSIESFSTADAAEARQSWLKSGVSLSKKKSLQDWRECEVKLRFSDTVRSPGMRGQAACSAGHRDDTSYIGPGSDWLRPTLPIAVGTISALGGYRHYKLWLQCCGRAPGHRERAGSDDLTDRASAVANNPTRDRLSPAYPFTRGRSRGTGGIDRCTGRGPARSR